MSGVEAGSAHPEAKSSGSLSLRGVAEVFYAPSRFFSELKENPKVLVPYLVLAAIGFIGLYFLSDLIVEAQKASPQYQRQMEAQGEFMPGDSAMKGMILGFGTFTLMLTPLLAALLGWFWGNFVFAGKSTFKKVLSVTLYGEIVYLAGMLVVTPLALMKGSLFVSLSLAALLPNPSLESPLFITLSKISVFHIWEIIVIGIGLAIMYGFPRNKGYLMSVLSMGLLAVVHVLFSWIMSLAV